MKMRSDPPRIALFGGTFDPIHLGHVRIAHAAKEALELDRVIFIPCNHSPHKLDSPLPMPGGNRMEMIRIARAQYPWMDVDACELEREGASYSWLTAEYFHDCFPDARLFWILGEDQWQALPRWSHPDRLAELVEFIVFSRNHRDPTPREGFNAWFLPEVHVASATEIRNALRCGKEPDGGHPWIDPAVMEFIHTHGLYGTRQ